MAMRVRSPFCGAEAETLVAPKPEPHEGPNAARAGERTKTALIHMQIEAAAQYVPQTRRIHRPSGTANRKHSPPVSFHRARVTQHHATKGAHRCKTRSGPAKSR